MDPRKHSVFIHTVKKTLTKKSKQDNLLNFSEPILEYLGTQNSLSFMSLFKTVVVSQVSGFPQCYTVTSVTLSLGYI